MTFNECFIRKYFRKQNMYTEKHPILFEVVINGKMINHWLQ